MVILEKQETGQLSRDGDAEAIAHLERSIAAGRHWYIALLEAIGLWRTAEDTSDGRTRRYLIDGEAFDWLLLAERLCESVNGLLGASDKEALLFRGQAPLKLTSEQVKELIGAVKYRQYLNYFYGIVVEGALVLAVQEAVDKERRCVGYVNKCDSAEIAFQRIYNESRSTLLRQFRSERRYPQVKSITLGEQKEFTYWLFKYRIKTSEKARMASDTRKALDYLQRQWAATGFNSPLVTVESLGEGC